MILKLLIHSLSVIYQNDHQWWTQNHKISNTEGISEIIKSTHPVYKLKNWGPRRVCVVPRCHLWLVGEPDQNKHENTDSWSSCLFHEIMFVKLSEKYKVWSGCNIWILNWVQIIWIPNFKEPKLNVCANLFSKPCPNANKKWMNSIALELQNTSEHCYWY